MIRRALALLLLALPLFADRRANVERGLLRTVPIAGETFTIADRMQHYGVPGVSIAVWKDGKIDWTAGYGNVKADTLLQAGSISKTLAAVAALRVLDRHRIPLTSSINAHLKSWQLPTDNRQPPTIEQILNHTAGLNVPGFPGFERGDPIPSLIDELEGRGNTQALKVVGDTHYSGGGYLLLQQLLVDLEKKPVEQILEAEVLRPAKMRDSTFVQPLPPPWEKRAATGTDEEGNPVPGGSYIYPEKTAAGLWTTAADVARFLIALQKGQLLSRAQTDRLLANNLGVFPFRKHYFAHPGGNTGFFAMYVASRTRPEGAVVLTNHENAEPFVHEIFRAIAKEYRWPEYVREPVKLAMLDASKFAGRYRFDADDALRVRADGSQLVVTRTAEEDVRLDPISATEFIDRDTGTTYVFANDTVTIGDEKATRTREAIVSDLMARDNHLGELEYEKLPPSLLTEERLRKRGLSFLEQRNFGAAVRTLQLNAKLHPESAAAHDALATALYAINDHEGARAASQRVLEALKTDWTPTASWRQVYRKRAERRLGGGTSTAKTP